MEQKFLLKELSRYRINTYADIIYRNALLYPHREAFIYGSERITVAVDARRNKQMPSGFELVVSGGTKPVGKDAIAWAKQCQDLGAGVILPTSMDGDGTQAGYDLEFTKAISDAVDLPVVASGGAGKLEHFFEAVTQGGADILLAASVFHYRIFSIKEVKEYLKQKGLQVNL